MRILFRTMFGASIFVALAVAVASVWKLGWIEPAAWATVAAALAVVAAVASAWTSQRVLELQEDAQQPNPTPVIDVRRRYGLSQFRITNHGGSEAREVRIDWDEPLRDADGKDVLLGRDLPIPVIPAGESSSVMMGASHRLFNAHADTTRHGTIRYKNGSGREFAVRFMVSAEHERAGLVHDAEEPKTLYELQKLPDELARVAKQVAAVGQIIKSALLKDAPAVEDGSSGESAEHVKEVAKLWIAASDSDESGEKG